MNLGTSLLAGRYRWLVCALLFAATTINYIDRQILSLVKSTLDEQLHWTNAQFGEINSAFQAAYAIGVLAFGWFIGRFGTRLGYGVSIAMWSAAAAGHALVSSVSGFFVARVALGLGEGGNFPSAITTVALWFPRRERAFATSLFNAGANVGAILAPALVPWITLTWGWHAAFLVAGVAGFLWLAAWFPLYDVPERIRSLSAAERAHISSDAEPETAPRLSWRSLLVRRETWAFIVAKFLTDPVWWFFLIWLPDFFKSSRHLDIKASGAKLVTIYTIVTVLSIGGGWITGRLTNRGWSITRARKTGMLLFALGVMPILFVTRVGDWTAVLLIGLAGAAHQAWSANLFTSVSDIFPKAAIPSVIGLGSMAGSVGGILFPLITGQMLDRFSAAGNVTGGYAVLFSCCGFAYLVAFALHHVLAPRFESLPAAPA